MRRLREIEERKIIPNFLSQATGLGEFVVTVGKKVKKHVGKDSEFSFVNVESEVAEVVEQSYLAAN